MKNQPLEAFTALLKKQREFRAQHAKVFNDFDKIYQARAEAELDLKDEVVRIGHDLQNSNVHAHYINGSPDGLIKPRGRVEIINAI